MAKNWLILGLLSFSVGFGISLTLDRDIKRAAITGLIALPATATGVLATEQWRKQQLSHQLSSLQQNITELEKQTEILKLEEGNLQKAISTATENKKQIEAALSSLQTEQYQFQTQVAAQQNQKQEFEQIFTTLESQKQQLETESNFLQRQLQDLRNQETELNSAIAKISDDRQNIQSLIKSHRVALDELQKQIAFQENYRYELSYNLTILEQNKQQIENEIAKLKNQIHPLKQDLAALNSAIIVVKNNYEKLQHDLSNLQTELHQLQQQIFNQQQRKDQLSQELGVMAAEKERLQVEISQLQDARKQAEENKQASIRDTKSELSTKLPLKVNEATSSYQASNKNYQKPRVRLGSNFRNSQYTKNIWEEQILPHWAHRNRPVGHRFLGSIRIKRQASEQILDIVGQNLQQFDRITYDSLQSEFYELEQNWLKILTCALSEYAYYYSNERFWQGFCERLDINHNQRVEIALRRIVDEGIDLLGLIRANGGYKYISTLWLQSGVPEQNLGHFAQLVQEIADEYGWWQIAHTPAEDLSQVLLDLCQEKHPQWGTLVNFLKASYAEDKETEPISGQLLQGIALIAQELERQNASPQVLEDDNEREELLGNYYLPQNFFLRNWNALIQVLTPKPGSSRSQNLITRRIKPLSMSLDIADTLNTQLLLPEQALWKPEWRNLRGTYCQIPQADWEDTIPTNGDLIIPELVIEVNQALDKWNCQLLDHNNKELMEWQYHGINSNLPCLLFNAVTGEHLPLQNQNPVIIGLEEIIFFTPNDIQPEFADGIEVLDSYIPSSIRGWRGRLIRLTKPESSILLTIANSQSQIINWKLLTDDEPILTGLRFYTMIMKRYLTNYKLMHQEF
ncbi:MULTISPECIES: hypothetical protein [unclassified Tolypothrix]|uniref:hypothetical protein n=1 Tax=unclassified Tolypothrix TaxID=2649714 RepID=UPI0005EAB27A|nr:MULTISPECIES: hypothetical protein [unclassified Tolypothrix]BAY95860.1 chromosome segregation ATPase-like protein [Microchaete diplosiphon NIES-3275]EKE96693.1 M protein repeat protein [Tolypothrix sp. PCC 7601]MBE9083114.1 hypothetical protein [Tolypothrix sp. LEGE 11397]UYD30828.1 hypothetical protein HGR01_38935 [Tolypothrix sp. PCC 7712]UYD38756.1 hypothetical protein HG267_40245 [Tolypothrix sp. PCC 7601]